MSTTANGILHHLSKSYSHPELTKSHIFQALMNYQAFIPKVDSFVFSNGEKKDLICLEGAMILQFIGNILPKLSLEQFARYGYIHEYCSIPICIWLLHRHPYQAPICYVRAATDMQIRVAKHVDPNGRIYLPYLYEWKSNTSNLVGLIQEMEIVFQEQPPLQPKNRSQMQHLEYRKQYIQTAALVQQSGSGDSTNIPIPNNNTLRNGYQNRRITAVAGGYSYLPVAPANNLVPASLPYPTTPRQMTSYPVGMPVSIGINGLVTTNGPPPTMNHVREPEVTLTFSSFEDKIKEKLAEIFNQFQLPAEMHLLSIDDKEGNSRCSKNKETKMEELVQKLEQELTEIEKNIILLREVKCSMAELLSKLQAGETFYIDESFLFSTPLYIQLLNAFAEEKAKDDAFYYLGEAFRRGVIDLDVFLKHVRELSRKDLMLCSLLHNFQEKGSITK